MHGDHVENAIFDGRKSGTRVLNCGALPFPPVARPVFFSYVDIQWTSKIFKFSGFLADLQIFTFFLAVKTIPKPHFTTFCDLVIAFRSAELFFAPELSYFSGCLQSCSGAIILKNSKIFAPELCKNRFLRSWRSVAPPLGAPLSMNNRCMSDR